MTKEDAFWILNNIVKEECAEPGKEALDFLLSIIESSEKAYNLGYEEGYNCGYFEGQWDGWNDGYKAESEE